MARPVTAAEFVVPLCRDEPTVLHQDDCLLVVNKPAGLLSVPGRDPRNRDCLIHRLQLRWPAALTVHRLDMDTSGVMVVALTREAQASLSRQFQERLVTKEYRAIVQGLPAEDEGTVELPLIADWPNRPLQKVCFEQGKPALTRYRVLSRDEASHTSRVQLIPETGRSHQLRVHMAALGHPIAGDKFYGDGRSERRADRLLLHAAAITVLHPGTGEPLTVAFPLELSRHLAMP